MSFSASLTVQGSSATIDMSGDLDSSTAPSFRTTIEQAVGENVSTLVLEMTALNYMSSAGLRGLVFARQKMGGNVEIVLVNPNEAVTQTVRLTGFDHSVTIRQRVHE
jgi:anti-anti-sigma factor